MNNKTNSIKITEQETTQPTTKVNHKYHYSLSRADDKPVKGSMSETAYIPKKQEPTAAYPGNQVYADSGNNATMDPSTNNANTIPVRTNKNGNNKGLKIAIAILAVIIIVPLITLLAVKIVEYNNKHNSSGVLRVGVSADFPPYEYIDDSGNFAGIEVEMLTAIAEELDLRVQFSNIPFENLFTSMSDGQVDCVVGGMEYTSHRQQIANVSNVLFTEEYDDFDFNSVIYIEKSKVDLQTEINNAISKLQKDGAFDKILEKHSTKTNEENSSNEQSEETAHSTTESSGNSIPQNSSKAPSTTTQAPVTTKQPSATYIPPTTTKSGKTCLSAGCNNRPKSLSSYCGEHGCSKSGCTSEKNYLSNYCILHKCDSLGCNNAKKDFGNYCGEHACANSICSSEKAFSSNYCNLHKCNSVGCQNEKNGTGRYCGEHACAKSGCTFEKSFSSNYCPSHGCSYYGCENSRTGIGFYCSEHTCIKSGCSSQKSFMSDYCIMHSN